MPSEGFEPPALEKFIAGLFADSSPEQLAALLGDDRDLHDSWRRPEPTLRPVPETTRGFRIRVDLLHTKPPVWRRIEVPGDILLPRLHDMLQATMGWTDSHLHRFRTGNDRNAAEFLTPFDVEEGDEGMLEDDVRLDQILAADGDRLWYEYDFGDGWEHVLRVEKVLDAPPITPVCVAGRLACPPEDCGGVWGYRELAEWVRNGYDDALVPEVFDTAEEGRMWLPDDWHPDHFDLNEVNAWIAAAVAEPGPVAEELAALLELARSRGSRGLRDILAEPASHGPTEIDADAAADMTASFRVLVDVIGDGVDLTTAGYLKPADVEQIAQRAGMTEWWIGKANREDLTWPVRELRDAARSLGLISVRKGRVTPTQAAKRCAGDPEALLGHIIGRLPLGKTPAERHAGWAALAVAGSDTPAEQWDGSISSLMFDLGWRDNVSYGPPPAQSPTLTVLELLVGSAHKGRRLRGVDAAVAAAARAVTRA